MACCLVRQTSVQIVRPPVVNKQGERRKSSVWSGGLCVPLLILKNGRASSASGLWCNSGWWWDLNGSDYRKLCRFIKAFEYLVTLGLLKEMPLKDSISAISVGIYQGQAALDLDYAEDPNAETDANFVITEKGIVEIQGTAEKIRLVKSSFFELLSLLKRLCWTGRASTKNLWRHNSSWR